MPISPWISVSRQVRNEGAHRQLVDVVFELPDGRHETFSLYYMGRTVAVLAMTDDKKIILARQFRPGPGVVLDELPGGGIDDDETPEDAVRRELLEETGYVCRKLENLGRPYECGYSTVERHAFLATGCYLKAEQRLDQNEFIQVVTKSYAEFMEQIVSGQCTDLEIAWMGLFRAGIVGVVK